jgi:hypothetical protein
MTEAFARSHRTATDRTVAQSAAVTAVSFRAAASVDRRCHVTESRRRAEVGASLGSVPIIECLPKFRESIAGPRNRHRWCGRRLTAAYRLAHRRPRATVFDAWNRVCGRKFSTKRQRADAQLNELGGSLMDTWHTALLQLTADLGLHGPSLWRPPSLLHPACAHGRSYRRADGRRARQSRKIRGRLAAPDLPRGTSLASTGRRQRSGGQRGRRPGLTHSRLQLDSGLGANERGPPEPAPSTKPSGLK